MRIRLALIMLLAFAMAVPGAAQSQEGVLFIETSRQSDGDEFTSTIRLLDDRIRFESSSPGEQQIFVYRGDMQVMYLIDPARQSYQEITRADLEALADQMRQMQAMMEEQLRNVPPQQRAMVEQMMQGMMPNAGAAPDPVIYTRISMGEQVGDWQCDRYEGRRGDEKVQEICTTDWRNLDLSAADFSVFQQLGDFFEALSSQMEFDLYQVGADPDASPEGAFPGVPVSRTIFINGQPSSFHEITEAGRQNFDSTLFEVPAGFTQAASPFEGLNQ